MERVKQYFCGSTCDKGKFKLRGWRSRIITILILIVYFIAIFSLGKYMASKYINSYPEEIYEYLETVGDTVVKNGAFYPTLLPENVNPSFLENGDLELSYKSSDITLLYVVKIKIKLSESFEIQSKTRNMLPYEYRRKVNMNTIAISAICITCILGFISILGMIISRVKEKIEIK